MILQKCTIIPSSTVDPFCMLVEVITLQVVLIDDQATKHLKLRVVLHEVSMTGDIHEPFKLDILRFDWVREKHQKP